MKPPLLPHQRIELRSPYLLIGLGGWPDAGNVSTYSASYLRDKLRCEKFGEIEPSGFYYYAFRRPVVSIEGGVTRSYELPSNELFYWKSDEGPHDLVILLGVEPDLNWPMYVEAILRISNDLNVRRIYAIGGVADRIPHTIETPVTAVVSNPGLADEVTKQGIDLTEYSGPSSVHSLIVQDCSRAGIEVISIWGHTPVYVREKNSKAAYHVLSKLARMINISLDLEDLMKEGEQLTARMDREVEEDPELKALVETLEVEYRLSRRKPTYIT